MCTKLSKLSSYVCIAVALLALSCTGVLAETTIKPSLGAHLTYDDNIIFSHYKPVTDWIYEILPAVEIDYQDERNSVNLLASGQGQHFNTESDLDTFDVDVNLIARRQQTERLKYSITGRYARDTTLDQTLLETGQLLRRENRQLYSVRPEVEWMINERSSISASLPWVKVNYDWRGNVDYDTLYFYLTYSYLLPDGKTKLFARPDIGRMNYDTGDYRTADFMCGLEHNFSKRLYARLLGGFNYTDAKTDIVVLDAIIWNGQDFEFVTRRKARKDHYWGWIAEGELKWLWDRGYLKATLTRRVSASGFGQPVINMYFTPALSWRITERLTGRIEGGISQVKSQDLTYDQDYWVYSARPSLTYRLTPFVNIGIYYIYQYLNDLEYSYNRDRNRIIFRIDIRDFNLHLSF